MANAELLQKVLRHIKDNPSEYDPVRWHRDFAGWTLRLEVPGVEVREDEDGIEIMYDAQDRRVWIADIGPWAQRLLGLDLGQAAALFCGANTLEDVERFVSEFTAVVTA